MALEPGKRLIDMVRASGLYDAVEARKQATLSAHLAQLQQTLGVDTVARMTAFVESTVRSQIRRGVPRQPASARLAPATEALRPDGAATSPDAR